MDMNMFGQISDAFGPSGYEEEVVRTIAKHCSEFDLENDAMNNLYARMPGVSNDKPVIQLDAHTDECGFMVQAILDNGIISILTLGGWQMYNLPAHTVIIRTRKGTKVRGIIISKPPHFMTDAEKAHANLTIETTYIDVGACSREEVINDFGIHIGDPCMPEVKFEYDAEHEICFGKAFDNRAGCACIIDTMKKLYDERMDLPVNVVGAFAAQEEVGMRGATVTAQVVKPDLAIVFEGSPSDDFFFGFNQTQGGMKRGVQIRLMDKSYVSNPAFVEFAEGLADKFGIPYQETVRRGGSTNAGKIHLTHKSVPVLVLGVPSRYVHSHYNFCARKDLEAATALAAEVIRNLKGDNLKHVLRQDIL